MKVLIVEDEEDHVERILRYIKKNISTNLVLLGPCKNLKQALPIIRSGEPEIALIDIQLGDDLYGGLNVGQIIREFHQIPIVFTSGLTNTDIVAQASEIPESDFLNKPFDERSFQNALNRALNSRRSEDSKGIKFEFAPRGKNRFWIKTERSHFRQINPEEIACVEAMDHYCRFYIKGIDPIISKLKLKADVYEEGLADLGDFHLLGRSFIINLDMIEYLDANRLGFKGNLSPGGKPIIIPNSQKKSLYKILNISHS